MAYSYNLDICKIYYNENKYADIYETTKNISVHDIQKNVLDMLTVRIHSWKYFDIVVIQLKDNTIISKARIVFYESIGGYQVTEILKDGKYFNIHTTNGPFYYEHDKLKIVYGECLHKILQYLQSEIDFEVLHSELQAIYNTIPSDPKYVYTTENKYIPRLTL